MCTKHLGPSKRIQNTHTQVSVLGNSLLKGTWGCLHSGLRNNKFSSVVHGYRSLATCAGSRLSSLTTSTTQNSKPFSRKQPPSEANEWSYKVEMMGTDIHHYNVKQITTSLWNLHYISRYFETIHYSVSTSVEEKLIKTDLSNTERPLHLLSASYSRPWYNTWPILHRLYHSRYS